MQEISSNEQLKSKLEQLFGSKTRVKLLYLFFSNPEKSYFIRELTRKLDTQINSVRRELSNLSSIGIIHVVQERPVFSSSSTGLKEKKYFKVNPAFLLTGELKNLFLKSKLMVDKDYIQQILNLGKIDYFVLTGKFSGVDTVVDMFIVGDVDKDKFDKVIVEFEKYIKKEINFTILDTDDYIYRRSISDKFLEDALSKRKIVIVDNLSDLNSLKQ